MNRNNSQQNPPDYQTYLEDLKNKANTNTPSYNEVSRLQNVVKVPRKTKNDTNPYLLPPVPGGTQQRITKSYFR